MKRVFQAAAGLLLLLALTAPGLALASCATAAQARCPENCPMMTGGTEMPGMSASMAGAPCCEVRSGQPSAPLQGPAATSSHFLAAAPVQATAAPVSAATPACPASAETAARAETPPSPASLCTFLI